jgi:Asp-tRNA(Asn)/Glu-tRNA(Gln) amidotransferase A subunit family amidase
VTASYPQTLADWLAAPLEVREAALAASLDRLRALEPEVRAWVEVRPQPPTGSGPLQGIPFGSKDIIELGGLATEYGSPLYGGRIGVVDAAIVRDLRKRGAILVGNTRCAAFAYRTAPATRNPRALDRTPGGSSSGAAAAVAAGMVPFALGTQTLGSILRPASYCGVTGFKPTFGVVATEGVLPFAPSLDTVGFLAHRPEDMVALWCALGHRIAPDPAFAVGVPEPLPDVDVEMKTAFVRAADAVRRAGIPTQAIDIRDLLAALQDAAAVVMTYEGAQCHRQRLEEHGDRLEELADLVREGIGMPEWRYDAALASIARGRTIVADLYRRTPIILVPAATGAAPRGLAYTGDARMNGPWTALGTPALSIPLPVDDSLPLGLQATADRGQDALLLAAAVRLSAALGSKPPVASAERSVAGRERP